MAENQKQELKVEIRPEVAAGHYSNLVLINNSPNEFILDFIQIMPGMPQANVQTRVVMAPENAKNLLFALRDRLAKYEADFGEITRKEPINKNNFPGNGGKFSA